MNIHNDAGGVDLDKFLGYIASQFATDLATIVTARDELTVRQGALSAAQDTVKLKADAVIALATANEEAAALRADAKVYVLEAKAQKTAADARDKALSAREDDFADKSDAREKALALREAQLAANLAAVEVRDSALFAALAKLDADRAVLDSRVKTFQDKVAALNV